MRQTTTAAEVRADEGKATDQSAPAHPTGWFDRLLLTRRAFTVAQDARRDDPGLAASRNPGNVGQRGLWWESLFTGKVLQMKLSLSKSLTTPMAVAILLLGVTAARAQVNANQCGEWMEEYSIKPFNSWGSTPADVKEIWGKSDCNHQVCEYMRDKYDVVPHKSWGSLPVHLQKVWDTPEVDCNNQ